MSEFYKLSDRMINTIERGIQEGSEVSLKLIEDNTALMIIDSGSCKEIMTHDSDDDINNHIQFYSEDLEFIENALFAKTKKG